MPNFLVPCFLLVEARTAEEADDMAASCYGSLSLDEVLPTLEVPEEDGICAEVHSPLDLYSPLRRLEG